MKFIYTALIYLLSITFFSINVFSQSDIIDSLTLELTNHKKRDSVRVNLLNKIAYSYYPKELEQSISYIEESEALADSLNYVKGKAKILYIKGRILATQSNFEESLNYFNRAIEIYKSLNHKSDLANCYSGIGILFYYKGDPNKAIDYHLKSIEINEELDNKMAIANSLNKIGHAHSDMGNYSDAIANYQKALSLNELGNNKEGIGDCLSNIGNIYSDQANYALALEYLNKSLVIDETLGDTVKIAQSLINIGVIYKNTKNYDKALSSYNRALKMQKPNGNKRHMVQLLNNLGLVYKETKDYEAANTHLKEALRISREIKNKLYIGVCLNNTGDVYLCLNDDKLAYQYFEEGKIINLEVGNQRGLCNSYLGLAKVYYNQREYNNALTNAQRSKDISSRLKLLKYQSEVEELLAKIYQKNGDYQNAYSSHQQFKVLNDSIFNKENVEKITQLEYEYKFKQALDSASIRELELTKAVELASRDLAISRQKYLYVIIAFLVLSMLLGSIIFYLKFRNIKTKNENMIMEQKLLRSQMTPHFIFNSLSVLQGMILNKENKMSLSYLSKFSKLLRITLENSRSKLAPLSQELLAIENYLALLNLEIEEPYQYSIVIDDNIDESQFQIPPMLIQPFIENAIEHAFDNTIAPRKIDVHLTYKNKELVCYITDNGIGINAQKAANTHNKNSLATTITTERLKALSKSTKTKGAIKIEDREIFGEIGTKVTLTLPYKFNVG